MPETRSMSEHPPPLHLLSSDETREWEKQSKKNGKNTSSIQHKRNPIKNHPFFSFLLLCPRLYPIAPVHHERKNTETKENKNKNKCASLAMRVSSWCCGIRKKFVRPFRADSVGRSVGRNRSGSPGHIDDQRQRRRRRMSTAGAMQEYRLSQRFPHHQNPAQSSPPPFRITPRDVREKKERETAENKEGWYCIPPVRRSCFVGSQKYDVVVVCRRRRLLYTAGSSIPIKHGHYPC